MATVDSLKRMSAKELSEMILAESSSLDPSERSYAIIDVRDDDHIGGNIKTSIHVPSTALEDSLHTLLPKLADKKTVVFHCSLSQQRGPSAALRYLRELDANGGGPPEGQNVYVLDLGFVGWAADYGTDQRLTQNFRKELWEGY